MIVVMALLSCRKDLGKAICLAVEAAFDTDCNGATVGSILGILLGKTGIGPYWYETFHSRLFTTITGYTDVTVEQLAQRPPCAGTAITGSGRKCRNETL